MSDSNQESNGENQKHPKRLPKDLESTVINWRRSQVASMLALQMSETEIAMKLGWDISTISKDVKFLRANAKEAMTDYLERELPMQHTLALAGLEGVIERARKIADKSDSRELAALSLIKDCLMDKQAILGSPEYIVRAIKARKRYSDQLDQLEQEVAASE